MCKQCELKPVYEFTNKRKLCARCFINYFEKKVLYIIRKFGMIKHGDIIGYKKSNNFRGVVLEKVLNMVAGKSGVKIVKFPNKKPTKIAVNSSIDLESAEIIKIIIKGKISDLKKCLPVEGKIIKPLYLFLDEEILLYAKLKKLKFVKKKLKADDKISKFLDESEKKHPEVKRAIVNGILELYNKKN